MLLSGRNEVLSKEHTWTKINSNVLVIPIWKQLLCVTTYKAAILAFMSSASIKTSQRKL